MPWETIECSDGAYDINRDGIMRIMRSVSWSRAVLNNSKIVTEVNTWGPNIDNVETDWKAVRAETGSTASDFYEDFFKRLEYGLSGSSCLLLLRDLVDQKDSFEASFQALKRKAQKNTMANIESSVQTGEEWLPVLEFVRDVSADTLMIGGTILSGGALTGPTLIRIGLGSLIKGTAKWEDTGHWQEGVFTGTTELVFGLLGVGLRAAAKTMEASNVDKLVLGLVFGSFKGAVETGAQVYSGKAVGQAMGRGGTKLLDPLVSEAVKQILTNDVWSTPVLAVMKYGMKKGADALTTPEKMRNSKPRLTTTDLTDAARPTRDFVTATAFQRWPGMCMPPF